MSESTELPDPGGSGRGLRRRRRAVGGRRTRYEVRVTPEEEGRLRVLALRYGVSIQKLLVDSTLGGGAATAAATGAERESILVELFKLHRLLANVANNVNQIARVANTTGEIAPETDATFAAARRTAERIDSVIDELSAQR